MLISASLLYLALFLFAADMKRYQTPLLGDYPPRLLVAHAGGATWALLVLSLLPVALAEDWAYAVLIWIGLVPLLAGALMLALSYVDRWAHIGVAVAGGLCLLAGAGALLSVR